MTVYERKSDRKPLVSVGMLVYNQVNYVRTAITSILEQEVNFDYEIVACDDFSTDGTREVLLELYEAYPNIIKLIFQDENVGMRLNSDTLRHNCEGKYRATLEGDDYWIKSDKLQLQFDFLEKNEDFIAIGGDFFCINDNGRPCRFPWGDIRYTYCMDDEYTIDHVNKWLLPAHASAMLFRNVFKTSSPEMMKRFEEAMIVGDRRTSLFLVLQGRIKHVSDVYFVRRVLTGNATSMTAVTKKTNWHYRNYCWLVEAERFAYDAFNVKLELDSFKLLRWKSALKLFFTNPNKENYNVMKQIYELCGEKKRYRKYGRSIIANKMKSAVKNNGLFPAIGKGIKYSFRSLGRLTKFNKGTKKSSEMLKVENSFVK